MRSSVAALLACGCDDGSGAARRLDTPTEIDTVILISIDSLRADRLGAYGHPAPTSPTLDRLAAEGLLFTRAYSTTSWTLPSHAAMLSGLDDYAHGAYQALSPISEGVTTLPSRLGSAGIESTGFFAGPFLHPSYGFARGFDRYVDATSYGWKARAGVGKNIPHTASHRDVTNPIVLEKVEDWLDARTDEGNDVRRRSFVFIHLWDVHYDYIPPPEYVEIFDPDYEGTLDGKDFLDNPRIRPDMPARDLRHLLALYDAEIRYTDDTVARLLEIFDVHGMLKKAAVLVTADHGEEFFDHGGVGHGLTLHEEVLRVPMILWIPGLRPARPTSDRIVSLIDLVPTVCGLFAVDCSYDGLGESLLPDYMGPIPTAKRDDALAELTNSLFGLDLTSRIDSAGTILGNNHSGRLTYEPTGSAGAPVASFSVNAKALGSYPDAVRRSVAQMRKRSAGARREGKKIRRGRETGEHPIDPRTLEQLEALGYLERKDAGGEGGPAPMISLSWRRA
jgi:arylsulfatase A-like enzyme